MQLRLLDDRRGGGQFAKAVANGVYGRLALRPDNPTVGWRRIHNKDLNSLLAYRKYETDGGVVLYEERTPPRARALWRNVG